MQPDIEFKPLYALIERKSSGDFALAVLRMFLGSKMAVESQVITRVFLAPGPM
ncbi:MAG: hypothetical protein ABSG53_01530 [Thermoguttaceae bacterium]|jgi:hypothetical protein